MKSTTSSLLISPVHFDQNGPASFLVLTPTRTSKNPREISVVSNNRSVLV